MLACAYSSSGPTGETITGGGTTWTSHGNIGYASRRRLVIFTADSPADGALTIAWTGATGTYAETIYSIVEVAGWDGTTEVDGSSGGSVSSAVAVSRTSVGVSGNINFAITGVEEAGATNLTADATSTNIYLNEDGGDVRSFLSQYSTDDNTMASSWTTSSNGGISYIQVKGGTTGTHAGAGAKTASGTPPIATITASGVAGIASSVVITDVNTTESWTDGDTGLVITGTGFI